MLVDNQLFVFSFFQNTTTDTLPDVSPSDLAYIRISNIKGQVIKELKLSPKQGLNEVLYEHGYGKVGTYIYSLYLNEELLASKRMIFDN
jgi:hypothetical protein